MYFSTFTTQAELVYHLKASNIVKSPSVIAAFCSVDRKNYCVSNYPYIDIPQTIGKLYHIFRADLYFSTILGCDQTISAPHMHGYALQLLSEESSRPNAKILDVGCGSGYLTALFARFNPSATVVGIDCFEELVELSRQNIMKEVKLISWNLLRVKRM
jgi:protein-L-isoaspartate(D-aspartate) O-methyltransferase